MPYQVRPALRRQWALMLLAMLLLFGLIGSVIETPVSKLASTLAVLLTFPGIPLLVICLIITYRHYSWRFTVAHGIIESRHGLIAREIRSIRVEDVRNINVKQSIVQRVLGIGDVEFSSAASTGTEVVFYGIGNPTRVKSEIQNMM